MKEYLLILLGFCLGFGLSALMAAGEIRRPNLPGAVKNGPDEDLTYHYDR